MTKEDKRLDEYEGILLEASRGVISSDTFEFLKEKVFEEVHEAIDLGKISREEFIKLSNELDIKFKGV